MRWLLTLYVLLILCGFASAQGPHQSKGTLDIHIVPLSLIDFNPRIRFGLEYHGINKFGYGLEVGWANHLFSEFGITETVWGNHYTFFEIRPEIKWYSKESERINKFYGAELFYTHLSDQLVNDYYYEQQTGDNIFFEKANFKRHKIGLMLKGGLRWMLGNRFTLDYSSGLGVGYRTITYNDQVNPHRDDLALNEGFYTPSRKKEGKYFVPQASLQVKFGYVIK